MSKWKYHYSLKDLWEAREKGNITIPELGKAVAKRIEAFHCYKKYEYELEEIALDFKDMVETVEDFDNILTRLYDWADGVRCWITTR